MKADFFYLWPQKKSQGREGGDCTARERTMNTRDKQDFGQVGSPSVQNEEPSQIKVAFRSHLPAVEAQVLR